MAAEPWRDRRSRPRPASAALRLAGTDLDARSRSRRGRRRRALAWRLGGELDWDELEALRAASRRRFEDGRRSRSRRCDPGSTEATSATLVAAAPRRRGRAGRAVTEALLSTEYGADGLPQPDRARALDRRRASLPLRVAGGPPRRGRRRGRRRTACAASVARDVVPARRTGGAGRLRAPARAPEMAIRAVISRLRRRPDDAADRARSPPSRTRPGSRRRARHGDAADRRARRRAPAVRARARADHRGRLPRRAAAGARRPSSATSPSCTASARSTSRRCTRTSR